MSNNVVTEALQFRITIRFPDGEMNGKPHERAYGFMIEAISQRMAQEKLREHLFKMIEQLDILMKETEIEENPALKPETDAV